MTNQGRIQGTDGIRGKVGLSDYPAFKGLSPLQVFLDRGILTEQFFELYCYCHVSLGIERETIKPGEEIILGWDPRDKDEIFWKASGRGIRKAGCSATTVGIQPTPAIPLIMLYLGAAGAFSITASHNPSDQNGIKVFLRDTALKPFIIDDQRLTEKIGQTDFSKIESLPLTGSERDGSSETRELFTNFCLDPRNSWAQENTDFSRHHLIVDCANGSYSGLAADIFRRLGVGVVEEWNNSLENGVNKNSGVADLDGIRFISEEMAFSPDGRFFHHPAIRRLFEVGREKRGRILEKGFRVSGAFFDADGDRFFHGEFFPFSDGIHILSGDETAFLQGKFLLQKDPTAKRKYIYVSTVESDLNASREALAIGFSPVTTPVGDKWILLHGNLIQLVRDAKRLMGSARPNDRLQCTRFMKEAEEYVKSVEADSEMVTDLVQRFERFRRSLSSTPDGTTKEVEGKEETVFCIGSEESGHTVTQGYLTDSNQREISCFIGNGLKSAINTLTAAEILYGQELMEDYYARLLQPFPTGFKQTLYVFYINRDLFTFDSPVYQETERTARGAVRKIFPTPVKIQRVVMPQEKDMLYLNILDQEKRTVATLFVRNSGTEDKIGVSLRSGNDESIQMTSIGLEVQRSLIQLMKDRNKPEGEAETIAIGAISQGEGDTRWRGDIPSSVSPDRLLLEMGPKQGLIHGTSPHLQLTELGQWYHHLLKTKP